MQMYSNNYRMKNGQQVRAPACVKDVFIGKAGVFAL